MANAGRVAIVPKGDWDSSEAYKRLDAVTYNNILYIAKKVVPKNTAVTNTDYWMPSVAGGVAVKATTKNIGQVQPDGETIEVDADGKISAKTALDTKPTIIATAEPNIVDTVESPMLVTNATKNLMNPILKTVTVKGVTYTSNADGTYTVNGTATGGYADWTIGFIDSDVLAHIKKRNESLFVPPIAKNAGVQVILVNDGSTGIDRWDYRVSTVGKTLTSKEVQALTGGLKLIVEEGVSVSNLLIKPMPTTDFSATYDDFVPYSGYEIKSCGKNLFDARILNTTPTSVNSNTKYSVSEGSITVSAVSKNTSFVQVYWRAPIEKFGLSVGDKVFFSIEIDTSGANINGEQRVYLYQMSNENDGSKKVILSPGKEQGKLDVIDDTDIVLLFRLNQNTDYNEVGQFFTVKNIQIEKSSAVTNYEPYKDGGTVHIDSSTEFPLLGLKSFDGETNIISPGNVEVTFAKNNSGKAILGMCKPTVKNLVSTVEGNPLDATMGAQLKKEIDELKAKVDAMSTSTTTE